MAELLVASRNIPGLSGPMRYSVAQLAQTNRTQMNGSLVAFLLMIDSIHETFVKDTMLEGKQVCNLVSQSLYSSTQQERILQLICWPRWLVKALSWPSIQRTWHASSKARVCRANGNTPTPRLMEACPNTKFHSLRGYKSIIVTPKTQMYIAWVNTVYRARNRSSIVEMR